MIKLIQTRKKSVDLGAPVARGARIRRDPPPPVKLVTTADIRDRDARNTVLGVIAFALALFVIMIGFGNAGDWSPGQHTIYFKDSI